VLISDSENQQSTISNQQSRIAMSSLSNYKSKHQHPINRLTHTIGIPLILISLPLFIWNWRWALVLFILGWILQFLGHAIETQPAFFKNPIYLLVGPYWLVRRFISTIGIAKSESK
jgi:uncharacterized membrane protein YGL010W